MMCGIEHKMFAWNFILCLSVFGSSLCKFGISNCSSLGSLGCWKVTLVLNQFASVLTLLILSYFAFKLFPLNFFSPLSPSTCVCGGIFLFIVLLVNFFLLFVGIICIFLWAFNLYSFFSQRVANSPDPFSFGTCQANLLHTVHFLPFWNPFSTLCSFFFVGLLSPCTVVLVLFKRSNLETTIFIYIYMINLSREKVLDWLFPVFFLCLLGLTNLLIFLVGGFQFDQLIKLLFKKCCQFHI